MEARTIVFLAVIAGATCGPLVKRTNSCAKTCTESNKFSYQLGSVYEYQYEAETETELKGSEGETSNVHIRATAEIHVQSQCEMILKLRGVTLEETDPKDSTRRIPTKNAVSFREALEDAPTAISFQDGRLEELCGSDEPAWVLNVKRGILSAFQNSMEHITNDHIVNEKDVAGNCKAQYKILERSYDRVSISKSKDLLGCTDRHNFMTSLQGAAYRVPSEIQSMPLMKSEHNCEQTFMVNGHLEKSVCHESHVFRPFSKQSSGASTTVKQTLKFLRRHQDFKAFIGDMSRRTSMLFEHEKAENGKEMDRLEAENTLREICEQQDSRPNTARLFSSLVASLRKLDAFTLREMHEQVHNGRVCKKNTERADTFFMDALPMVSTSGSLGLIRDLVVKGEVNGIKSDVWMNTIAFIAKPSLEMLREIKPILNKKPRQQTVLAVSALVNSYCRNNKECSYESEVQDITNTFIEMLGTDCAGAHDKVILALKALGNSGAAPNAVPTLNRCVANDKLAAEIRVAAIQAFRRQPCDTEKFELVNLLKDTEADAELRIAAYNALMQCPTKSTLSVVRAVLENEEINQVGSFIWTHLTNIKETSDPLKQEIKSILENEPLKKTFNLDQRKFSRNYEGSVFFNSINTGAQIENNLIWSQKSYVPRSAMLNLTVDMFGQSVNLLELGGRVEGMERTLEAMFGPDGYFTKEKNAVAKRGKRAATNDPLAHFQKLFDTKSKDLTKGSAYMKIFGNELGYYDVHDFDLKNQKDSFNFLELLIKLATDHKVDFSKSATFLDTSVSIPTMVGLPLKLSVQGTASVDVHIAGHADLRKVAARPRSLDIKGYVKPSASVEIVSTMSVDVAKHSSGLKMVSTLHSSTEVDGSVTLDQEKAITMNFNMPRDKIELLDVQTKFFVVGGEREVEQTMSPKTRTEKKICTGAMTHRALGVKMCGEISLPEVFSKESAPYYPFTGPTSMKVYIDKTDSHKGYTFNMEYDHKKNAGRPEFSAKLGFNTPGSKIDRDIGFDFVFKTGDKVMDFSVRTPWKKVSVGGSVTSKKGLKAFSAKFMMDTKREWSVAAQLKTDLTKVMVKYSPSVTLRMPGSKDITFNGFVQNKANKGASMDLSLTNLFKKPISVKGSVLSTTAKSRVKYTTNLAVVSQWVTSKLSGFADNSGKRVVSRMQLAYTVKGMKPQRFVANYKLRDLSNKIVNRINANMALQTTEFPDYNCQLILDGAKTSKKMTSSADFRYGKNKKDLTKRIYLNQVLNYFEKKGIQSTIYNMKLIYKAQKINMKTKIDHRQSANDAKTNALITYAPGKNIKYNMILKKDLKKLIKVSADVTLSYPGRQMSFSNNLIERTTGNYHNEMIAQWQKGKQVRTMTVFTNRNNKQEMKTEITLPKTPAITVSGSARLFKDNFAIAALIAHKASKYGTSLSYSYTLGAKPSLKGAFDVQYLNRQVTGEGMLSKVGNSHKGKMELKWDAARNPSQRLLVDGAVLFAKKKDMSLKIKYPSRLITVNMNHNVKGDSYVSHAEASWTPKDKVAIDSNVVMSAVKANSKVTTDIRFTSPFKNFENIHLLTKHVGDKLQSTGDGKFSWNTGKEVTTKYSLKSNGLHQFNGKMSVATPFDGLNDIAATVNHKLTKLSIASDAEMMVNKQKASVSLKGKNLNYKSKQIVEGGLDINTPVYNVALKTDNRIMSDQVVSHMEAELQGKTYKVDLSGKSDAHDLEGAIRVRTPAKYAKDVSLSAKHSVSGNRIKNEIAYTWDKNFVKYSSNIKLDGLTTEGSVITTSSFKGFEKMAVNWNGELSRSVLLAHLEMEAAKQKVLLDIAGNHKNTRYARDITGKVLAKSPFMEDVSISGSHHMSMDNIKTNIKAAYAKDQEIEFNIEGDSSDIIIGKVELKTPFSPIKDISVSGNAHTKKPYSGHLELMWARNKKIALDAEFTGEMKGEVRFTSPFPGFRRFVLNGEHTSIDNVLTNKMNFEYAKNKKIETSLRLGMTNGLILDVEINTPCPKFNKLAFNIAHQGSSRNFNNALKIEFESDVKLSYNSKLQMKSYSLINGNFELTTPFTSIEKISGKLNHRFQKSKLASEAEISLNGEKVEYETELEFNKNVKGSLSLKTPFAAPLFANIDASHNDGSSQLEMNVKTAGESITLSSTSSIKDVKSLFFDASVSSTLGDIEYGIHIKNNKVEDKWISSADVKLDSRRKITLNTQVTNTDTKAVSFSLKTPFNILKKISFSSENTINRQGFVSKTELDYPKLDGKMTLEAQFKKGKATTAKISFTSPFSGFENIEASAKNVVSGANYKTSANLKYQRGKAITVSTSANVYSATMFDVQADITTPFDGLKTGRFAYNHRGSMKEFNCEMELEHNSQKLIKFNTHFEAVSTIKGSLVIKTAYSAIKSLQVSFSHDGNSEAFTSKGEMVYNGQRFASALTAAIRPSIKIEFSVSTPFENMRETEMTIEHTMGFKYFTSSAMVTYGDRKTIKGDVSVDYNNQIAANARFMSPFKHVEDISMSFNLKAKQPSVSSSMEIKKGQNKMASFEAEINAARNFNADVKLSVPQMMKDVHIEYDQKLKSNSFESSTSVSYDGIKKISTSSKLNAKNGLSIDFTLKTPYTKVNNIVFSAKHQENARFITTEASLVFNNDNIFDVMNKLSVKPTIDLDFKLNTIYPMVRNAHITFNHKGSLKSFSVLTSASVNDVKIVNFNGQLTVSEDISAAWHLKTSFMQDIHFTAKHSGSLRSFVTNVEASYENGKKISMSANVNIIGKIEATFNLKTPCRYVKDISVIVNHHENTKSFRSHAKVVYNGKEQLNIQGSFNMQENTAMSLSLTTPYEQVNSLTFTLNQEGKTGHVDLTFNGKKMLQAEGSILLTSSPEVTFSMKSPYELSFSGKHQSNRRMYSSYATLSFNGKKQIEINSKINLRNRIDVTMSLETPYQLLKDVSVNIRHRGDMKSFSSILDIVYNGVKQIDAQGRFDSNKKIDADFELKTPFENVRNMQVIFKHEGEISSFVSEFIFNHERNQMIRTRVSSNTKSNIDVELSLQSAFTEDLLMKINHLNRPQSYVSTATVKYNNENKINVQNSINTMNGVSVDFKFQTSCQYVKDIQVILKHDGNLKVFKSEFSAFYDEESMIKTTTEVDVVNKIMVSFSINTPYFKEASFKVNHEGTTQSSSTFDVTYGSVNKVHMEAMINTINGLSGDFKLKTACQYVKDIHISLNHDGSLRVFKNDFSVFYDEEQMVKTSMKVNTNNKIKLSFSISTPYFKDTTLKINHQGTVKSFKSSADVSYDGEAKMHVEGKLSTSLPIEMQFAIKSPYETLKHFSVRVQHNGNSKSMSSQLTVQYNGQEINTDMQLKNGKTMEAVFTLKTPFESLEMLRITTRKQGNMKNVEFSNNIEYNDKSISLSGELKTKDEISASLRFASPFKYMEEINMAMSHSGRLSNFRCHGEVSYGTYEKVQVDARLNTENKIDGLLQFRSPFENFKNIFLSIDHQGSMNDFTCHCEFSYAEGKNIKVDGRYTAITGINGVFKFTTPFEGLNTLEVALKHSGVLSNFNSLGKISINENTPYQADVSFAAKPHIASKIQIQSPIKDYTNLVFTMKHESDDSQLAANVDLEAEGVKIGHADAALYRNKMEANVHFRNPTSGRQERSSFVAKYTGDMKSFNGEAVFSINDKKFTSKGAFSTENMMASASLNTPYTKKAAFDINLLSKDSYMGHFVASYGNEKIQVDGNLNHGMTEGNIHVQTPHSKYNDMSSSFRHTSNNKDYQTAVEVILSRDMKFTFNSEIKGFTASVHLTTPFEITKDVSLKFIQDASMIKVQFSHNGKEYSAVAMRNGNKFTVTLTSPVEGYEKLSFATFQRVNGNEIKGDIKLTNGNKNMAVVAIHLKKQPEVMGNIEFMAPFMKNVKLNFKHSGTKQAFTSEGDISYAEKKIGGKVDFDIKDGISLNGQMTTPIENMEQMSFSLKHQMSGTSFNTMASIAYNPTDEIKATISFSKVKVEATLTTPFESMKSLRAVFSNEGRMDKFTTSASVTHNDENTVGAQIMFNKEDNEMKITIETPIRNVNTISFHGKITHKPKFQADVSLSYANGKTISLLSTYKMVGEQLQGTIAFSSPFTKKIEMQVIHKGTLEDFTSSGLLVHGKDKTRVKAAYRSRRGVPKDGSIIIKSTTDMLEKVTMSFKVSKHNDGSDKVLATISLAPGKTITATGLYRFVNRRYKKDMSASVKIDTPYKGFRSMSAKYAFRKDSSMVSGMLNADLEGQNIVLVDTKYQEKDGRHIGSLNMKYNKKQIVNTDFDGQYVSKNGQRTGALAFTFNGQQLVDAGFDTKYQVKNGRHIGSIVATHKGNKIIDVALDSELENTKSGNNGKLMIKKDGKTILDGDVSYSVINGRYDATINLRTPFKKTVAVNLVNTEVKSATIKIDNQYSLSVSKSSKDGISIRVVTSSRTVAFNTKTDMAGKSFTHKTEFTWDEQNAKKIVIESAKKDRSSRYQNAYEITGKLTTPIRSVSASLDHSSGTGKCNNNIAIQWDAERNPEKKLKLKADYAKKNHVHSFVITLGHPELNNDIVLRNELAIEGPERVFYGLSELKYSDDARDNILVSANVNKATSNGFNYTADIQLSQRKTLLNTAVRSHVAYGPSAMSAGISANYLTTKRRNENFALIGKIDKLRKQINMEMVAPGKVIEMNGKMVSDGSRNTISMKNTVDRKQTLSGVVMYDSDSSDADVKVFYDPENPKNLYHAYVDSSPSQMKLEAYNMKNGRRQSDAEFNVQLKNKKLFHTRMYWRPSMFNDVYDSSSDMVSAIKTKSANSIQGVSSAMQKEYQGRNYYMTRMLPSIQPIGQYVGSEMTSLSNDLNAVSSSIDSMVYYNEFYLRDILRAYKAVVSQISNSIDRVIANMDFKALTEMQTMVEKSLEEMKQTTSALYAQAMAKYQILKKEVAEKLVVVNKAINRLCSELDIIMRDMAEYINAHPYYVRSVNGLTNVMTSYQNAMTWSADKLMKPVYDAHMNVKRMVKDTNGKLSVTSNKALRLVKLSLEQYQTLVNKVVRFISEYEYPTYVQYVADQIMEEVKEMYGDMNLKENMKRFAMNAIQTTIKSAKSNVAYMLSQYLHLEKDKVIAFDLNKGIIEFQVYVPITMPTLKALPNYHIVDAWKGMKESVNSYIPRDTYMLWDMFYMYKPSSDMTNWIPPFKAYAVLAGNQHYTTFDKRQFEFAGQCSYVLARDFTDAKFSVIVNYDNSGVKRSLTVISDNKQIQITPTLEVSIDDKKVELPTQFADTKLIRSGNTLHLMNKHGLVVSCDKTHDVCTIAISGWFFGKTAGLLGTYDNEPSNDFKTPEGALVATVEDFASSWRTGSRCGDDNLARVFSAVEGRKSFKACSDLFRNNKSPLRPCYKIVNPERYFHSCINDAEDDTTNGICKSAAMYVKTCNMEGVPLRLPRQCVKCESHNAEDLHEGQQVTINNEFSPKSADVVFVVEEKKCNKKAAFKLKSIIAGIDKALRMSGMKGNRYGLVGFGGSGVHDEATMHTIHGQQFGGIREMVRSLSSLEFKDGQNTDTLSSIRYAARYPFRAGVSKTIVLLTCNHCGEQEVKYDELLHVMNENEIRLHILREEEFKMSEKQTTPHSAYLFGVDSDAAYTSAHVSEKTLVGDKKLFGQLALTRDVCMQMAQVTGGSVFNMNKMTDSKVNFQKHFLDVFSRRVARSAEPTPCQVCECSADVTGTSVSICRSCSAKSQTSPSQEFIKIPTLV